VACTYPGTVVKLDSNGHESSFASGLNHPAALAFDNSGNLYVGNTGNQTIWKYNPSGQGAFFASAASGNSLFSLACDSSGNLYELISLTIMKYDLNGQSSVFANINNPYGATGLAFDKSGNLYTANYGISSGGDCSIMRFDSAGHGTVFAAGLQYAAGLAFDSSGSLYEINYDGKVEKFDSTGQGTIFTSNLHEPMGIAIPVPEPTSYSLLVLSIMALLGSQYLHRR
jgi:tripartite motif-containing protein 71